MIDFFGGNVFNVGRSSVSTNNLSVDNYIKKMGVSDFGDVEFDPLDYTTDSIDSTQSEAYYNSLKNFNTFGLHMAAKGVDVMNPDPNNPKAVLASRMAQELSQTANQQLLALKTSFDVKKEISKRQLQFADSRIQGGAPIGRLANADDFLRQKPGEDILEQIDAEVKSLNDNFAKEFDGEEDVNNARLRINNGRNSLFKYKEALMSRGYDEAEAERVVLSAQSRLGDPTKSNVNPLDDELKRARIAAANRSNRGSTKEGPKKEEAEKRVRDIQKGEPFALESLKGKTFGRGTADASTIEDVEYVKGASASNVNSSGTGPVADIAGEKIILTLKGTQVGNKFKQRKIEIDLSDQSGQGFLELINIIGRDFNVDASDFDDIENIDTSIRTAAPIPSSDQRATVGGTTTQTNGFLKGYNEGQ